MSKVYNLKTVQFLPISIEKAWEFFSNPTNLSKITPEKLKFKVLTENLTSVYAGQIIEYKVHPILGIPLYWMTEITSVEYHKFFVDNQRYGPYSMWHHQHHFKVVEGGVEMTDIVHYKLPFWFLGDIANVLFVKAQLKEIFDYRIKAVEKIF